MTRWSRREVLAALATSGAWAAIAPLLAGCTPTRTRVQVEPITDTPLPLPRLRAQLRELVSRLSRDLEDAYAAAHVDELASATLDAGEATLAAEQRVRVHLGGHRGGRWREQVIASADPARVRAAAEALVGGSLSAPRAGAGRRLFERDAQPAIDPHDAPRVGWTARLAPLLERAESFGGSRVVYRGAYLRVRDRQHVFVGGDREVSERQLSTRAGVAMVAWTGDAIATGVAERAGALGLEALELGDDALAAAAERAVELLTARAAPSGELDLVLAPDVAALLAHRCVGDALTGDLWLGREALASTLVGVPIASESVTLVDDPSGGQAFGDYAFDDEGWPSAPAALIERGRLVGPLTCRRTAAALRLPRTGHGRRAGATLAPRPGHLLLAAGDATGEELVAEVGRGLLVEGAAAAGLDARSFRVWLRAQSAKEIVDGRWTGRRFGGLTIAGAAPEILRSVRGVGRRSETFAVDDERGAPLSRQAPALLLTAAVHGEGA